MRDLCGFIPTGIMTCAYELRKIQVGAEVYGINLSEPVSSDTVTQIKSDVTKHKLLIFKKQGIIDPNRQIEITEYFGEVETAGFDQHEKSPHRSILRVSNDESEGFKNFGTAGLHIDGSFMENPNSYSIYHIISTSVGSKTVFVDIDSVLQGLSEEQFNRWQRLYIVKVFDKIRGYTDTAGSVVHPLVYLHPVTKQQTMCLHLGKTGAFIWDLGTPWQCRTHRPETRALVNEIDAAFRRNNEELLYYHQWEVGDFIISDNLAVAHLACQETQLPPDQVGLRVMHRTIVRGTNRPHKDIFVIDKSQAQPVKRRKRRIKPKCLIS